MVQPTDRIIAKILLKVIRSIFRDADIPALETALILSIHTQKEAKNNKEIIKAVADILLETMEEDGAEALGTASSNVGPVAPPWNEDAGSDPWTDYDEESGTIHNASR